MQRNIGGDWRAYGILSGLFVLSAGFIAYVIAPATVLPLFVSDFGIDKPTASATISAVFLTWAVLQLPGGYVMDRYDNRRLVLLGGVVFVVAAIGGLVAAPFWVFVLTRLVSGACVVFVFVGSVNILESVLPAERRAIGVSLFVASPPFGLAVAQVSGPQLATPFGWRTAMLVYVLVAALGLGLVGVLLRQPILAEDRATVGQFVRALRNTAVLLVSLASFCTYAVWTFLNTWMPSYGTEVLGFELAAAGAATALVPLAGIVSRPGGGWLSDRLGGRLRPIILVSFLATALLLYGLNSAPSAATFVILLALIGGAVNLSVGLYLVYVTDLAAAATPATSLAVLLTFSQVGNLVAPVAGGWVIEELSWTAGFGFAAALAGIGIVAILLSPGTVAVRPPAT